MAPDESRVETEMDAMDSIILRTFYACCTIQLLWHLHSHPHDPLQLPAYEPLSLLDQGCRRDQAAQGNEVLHWEYLQVVVCPVCCVWVDYYFTPCWWPFRCTHCTEAMIAQGDPSSQVVGSCWLIALHIYWYWVMLLIVSFGSVLVE